MSNGALRRTARRGDGWVATSKGPDDIKEPLETLREMTVQEGRNPDDLQICMLPMGAPSVDQLIQDLPRYEELGVQHVYLLFREWTDEFSELMRLMEHFAKEMKLA